MSAATVLTERRDAVAIVTLNRPGRRNGVTVDMCIELHAAVQAVAESDARVLVLRGAGNDFCVGADIGGLPEGAPPQRSPREIQQIYHASTLLHTMKQVTIAAIDGGCAGAGMGWAAACDLRFASHEARFNTAFLAVGFPGDMGLVWSLDRILGGARAREWLLLPGKIAAEQALAAGFVSRLYARPELHEEVLRIAAELAGRDPFALEMLKANTLSAERLDIGPYIDVETGRHLAAAERPGLAERMAAGLPRSK